MRITLGGKRKNKETTDSNIKTYIQKAIDGEGGTIHIYRFDPENGSGPQGWALSPFDSDVKDWKDRDVESYLNAQHGGGRYHVRVDIKGKDGKETEYKMFDFSLAGEPKEGPYEQKKTKQAETQQVTDIFKTAMEFAKDVKGGDGGNTALTQTLIQSLMSQITEMRKENTQLIMKLISEKETGGGMSEIINNMMRMEEFKSMLQPKVENNETIEIIRAASPILAGFLAGKTGQPEQVRMIEAPPPGGENLSLGSASLKNQGQPSLEPSKESIQDPSEVKIPNGTSVKRDAFEMVMLDPLITLIDSEAPNPEEIAQMIQMIINWSFTQARVGIEPHHSVLDLVMSIMNLSQGKGDFVLVEKAYVGFAKSIEMPDELSESVKQELLKIYMPLVTQVNGKVVEDGQSET